RRPAADAAGRPADRPERPARRRRDLPGDGGGAGPRPGHRRPGGLHGHALPGARQRRRGRLLTPPTRVGACAPPRHAPTRPPPRRDHRKETAMTADTGVEDAVREQSHSLGRAALRGATLVALVALLALAAAVAVVPRVMGGAALTVLTGSMEPTYAPGDMVVAVPQDNYDRSEERRVGKEGRR